jgi:hypothetical protein
VGLLDWITQHLLALVPEPLLASEMERRAEFQPEPVAQTAPAEPRQAKAQTAPSTAARAGDRGPEAGDAARGSPDLPYWSAERYFDTAPEADVPLYGHLGPVWTQAGLYEPELDDRTRADLDGSFDRYHQWWEANLDRAHFEREAEAAAQRAEELFAQWGQPGAGQRSIDDLFADLAHDRAFAPQDVVDGAVIARQVEDGLDAHVTPDEETTMPDQTPPLQLEPPLVENDPGEHQHMDDPDPHANLSPEDGAAALAEEAIAAEAELLDAWADPAAYLAAHPDLRGAEGDREAEEEEEPPEIEPEIAV